MKIHKRYIGLTLSTALLLTACPQPSTPTADTTKPTVSLTADKTSVTAAGALKLTANAADNVGVAKVEFYEGTTLLETDSAAPYEYTKNVTTAMANGDYTYFAKAYDAAGNSATSTGATVNINIPRGDSTKPTVSLVANQSTFSEIGNLEITATATDNVGVTKVEFYKNGTKVSTVTTAPYKYSEDITNATARGTLNYTAKAYDAEGNVETSTASAVTVSIAGTPTTPITAAEASTKIMNDVSSMQQAFSAVNIPTETVEALKLLGINLNSFSVPALNSITSLDVAKLRSSAFASTTQQIKGQSQTAATPKESALIRGTWRLTPTNNQGISDFVVLPGNPQKYLRSQISDQPSNGVTYIWDEGNNSYIAATTYDKTYTYTYSGSDGIYKEEAAQDFTLNVKQNNNSVLNIKFITNVQFNSLPIATCNHIGISTVTIPRDATVSVAGDLNLSGIKGTFSVNAVNGGTSTAAVDLTVTNTKSDKITLKGNTSAKASFASTIDPLTCIISENTDLKEFVLNTKLSYATNDININAKAMGLDAKYTRSSPAIGIYNTNFTATQGKVDALATYNTPTETGTLFRAYGDLADKNKDGYIGDETEFSLIWAGLPMTDTLENYLKSVAKK